MAEQRQTWNLEIQNDPEIGGQRLPETIANIGRVMDRFATPEIRELLDQSGLGDHPQLVRFMNAIGKQFAEGRVLPNGQPQRSAESAAKTLYPNLN